MRNRAKCKLCNEIIESLSRHDYVTCKCGEISVDGGLDYCHCRATDFSNFIRVDDEGNEIVVTYIDKKPQSEEIPEKSQEEPAEQLTKAQKVDMLKAISDSIENLPSHAMQLPITHYDYQSLLLLLISILRED